MYAIFVTNPLVALSSQFQLRLPWPLNGALTLYIQSDTNLTYPTFEKDLQLHLGSSPPDHSLPSAQRLSTQSTGLSP